MNGNRIIRVLAVLVCALMLIQCTALGVFAAEISPEAVVYVRPEVTEIVANQIGKNYVYVDVACENSDQDQTAIVYLTDANGDLVTLAYAAVSSNAVEAKLGVPDSAATATYKIAVALNKAEKVYTSEIFYIGVEDVDGFFEAINSTDETVVAEKLEVCYEALSVVESTVDKKLTGDDYEALSANGKKAFAELVANGVNGEYSHGKGEYDAESSESFVKEAYVVAAYNEGGFSNKALAELIYSFAGTIGFDAEDENLYGKIENKGTLVEVLKTVDKKINNCEELAAALETAAGIQIVNETHWLNLVNVIAENNDLFGIDEDQIKKIQKKSSLERDFCEEFKGTYYSIDDIKKAWKSAYKEVTSDSSSGPSGPSTEKVTISTNVVYTQLSNTENNYDPNVEILDYYTDVANSSYEWACDDILSLTKAGVVSGYGDKTFAPGKSLTRAEFVKMVVNVFGLADLTATSSFTDVDENAWYYIYVASAEKCGLTTGYGDGTFGVNDTLTRQDAITLVYRAAKIKGISVNHFTKSASNLRDKDAIAAYALEGVEALYNAGVYLDASDPKSVNMFEPTKNASRAYISVILNQVYTYMN